MPGPHHRAINTICGGGEPQNQYLLKLSQVILESALTYEGGSVSALWELSSWLTEPGG